MSAAAEAYSREHERLVDFFCTVAAEKGCQVPDGSRVLDFGCGRGSLVRAFRAAGFDAAGCDIVLEKPADELYLIEQPYRLPFPDGTFDFVVSNQVLEHVRDHSLVFRELRRVLKAGAPSIHLFPARWAPIEVHLRVPFGGVVQAEWWLELWARAGIRNRFQQDLPWQDVAALNREYLSTKTNYVGRASLLVSARTCFGRVEFAEALAIKHGRRTRAIYPLVRRVPQLAAAYGVLRAQLLFLAALPPVQDPPRSA